MPRDSFRIHYSAVAARARSLLGETGADLLEGKLRTYGGYALDLQAEHPSWLKKAVAAAPHLELVLDGHRVVFAVDTEHRTILVEALEPTAAPHPRP